MTLWGRSGAYEGGPTVMKGRPAPVRDPRARSAEGHRGAGESLPPPAPGGAGGGGQRGQTNFGFGSGTSRFTVIQSSPASPMVDNLPMFWTVKDIDIGDGGSSASAGKAAFSSDGAGSELFGHKPFGRIRSRHDCHFAPGSYVLGKLGFPSMR